MIILDNGWTAQTGFENNPGTIDLREEEECRRVELMDIVRSCGVENVILVDPYQYQETMHALKKALSYDSVSVVIVRRECSLQAGKRKSELPLYTVNIEKCNGCQKCIKELACPAMNFTLSGKTKKGIMQITSSCFGCGLCQNICPTGAIEVMINEE